MLKFDALFQGEGNMRKKIIIFFVFAFFLTLIIGTVSTVVGSDTSDRAYLGQSVVNAGDNTGFSKENAIDRRDIHFGWRLGRFFVVLA
jgi:hypothetical protein